MVKTYRQNQIDKLVKILNKDGVVSVPTDTVFGLCASMNSEKGMLKIMKLKERPQNKILPIMCANKEQIESIAYVNKNAEKLIESFMPGPITIILNKKENVPAYVNNGGNTLAIRMATSDALKELILKLGCPIFLTSANKSGEPPCENLVEIAITFPELDGMLAGDTSFKKSSTIIDCTTNPVSIVREGPITLEEITLSILS